jgi:periplasmic protein TonB
MSALQLSPLPGAVFSYHRVLKLLSAGTSALLITFLLFAAMQQLIKAGVLPRQPITETGPVILYSPPKETEPTVRKQLPKMPPPEVRPQPAIQPQPTDPANVAPGPVVLGPVELVKSTGPMLHTKGDRGATPLVRVEPRYPVDAARDGISGWVRLGFNIDETGAVTDITVLAAEPARLFNREAMNALRRWKYQPQIVAGKPIKQLNMQVQLDFSLQNN